MLFRSRPSPEEQANAAFASIRGGGEYEELDQDYMARQRPSVMPRAASQPGLAPDEAWAIEAARAARLQAAPAAQTSAGTAYAGEGRGISHAQDRWIDQAAATVPINWKETARELVGSYSLTKVEAKRFPWGQQQTTPSGTQFVDEATGELALSAEQTGSIVSRAKIGRASCRERV